MNNVLTWLSAQQAVSLQNIAVYIDGHDIPIANGSFGTGYHQAKMIVTMLTKMLTFGRGTTKENIEKYTVHMVSREVPPRLELRTATYCEEVC